jgi:hypothetical protein
VNIAVIISAEKSQSSPCRGPPSGRAWPHYAEGRLRTSSWEDTAGLKRTRTEVVLEDLKFVGAKPHETAA